MKKQNKLPLKKTIKKYSFRDTFSGCTATSDPDPTTTTTLSTTHIWNR
jgi:hypothetical protein